MRKRVVIGISAGVVVAGAVYGPRVVREVKSLHETFITRWNENAEEKGVSQRNNLGDVLTHMMEDHYHRRFNEIVQSIQW